MTTPNQDPVSIRIGTTTELGPIYRQFHLTDAEFRRNITHVGGTPRFRNRFTASIIPHLLRLRNDRAVVIIDPTGNLPLHIRQLPDLPREKPMVVVDLNHPTRPTDLNLINPQAFPDRSECVDAIISAFQHNYVIWDYHIENLFRWILNSIYDHNTHPHAQQHAMNLQDAFDIIDELPEVEPEHAPPPDSKLAHALAFCDDPDTITLKDLHIRWPKAQRDRTYLTIRLQRQREDDTHGWGPPLAHARSLSNGIAQAIDNAGIVLFSGGAPRLADESAALACNWAIKLVRHHMMQRDPNTADRQPPVHLICQHFTRIQSASWAEMHHLLPRQGCYLFLSTGHMNNDRRNFEHIRSARCFIVSRTAPEEAYNIARFVDDRPNSADDLSLDLLPEDQAIITTIDNDSNCHTGRVSIDIHETPATLVRTIPPSRP